MTDGNGSLSSAWEDFDDPVKLNLAVNELDRIYRKINEHTVQSSQEHSAIRVEMTNAIASIKTDFNSRIDLFRAEVRDSFGKVDAKQSRTTGWLIGAVGSLLVGLALLVAQLASS